VDGHFRALDAYRTEPGRYRPLLATRLRLDPGQVDEAYAELDLPDRARNRAWFSGQAAQLRTTANELGHVMRNAGLLSSRPETSTPLFDGRFL
jgi:hypothetical protein